MSERHPLYGIALATFGALILTPDTYFMRLTGMDGAAMLAWRGLVTGFVFLASWLILARGRAGAEAAALVGRGGWIVILSHAANATLFSFAVAAAPVSVVLFAVATMPVFAAFFARIAGAERAGLAAWLATAAVLAGIGLAVFGRDAAGAGLNAGTVFGAVAGLGVAAAMALTFVTIRFTPGLPILPAMGLGSLFAGALAAAIVGWAGMAEGQIWAALTSAALILPASFAALSFAARHTAAVNVSLLLLLETILGPVWVWIGLGEAMSAAEIAGGAIVIASLALYILHAGRTAAAQAA